VCSLCLSMDMYFKVWLFLRDEEQQSCPGDQAIKRSHCQWSLHQGVIGFGYDDRLLPFSQIEKQIQSGQTQEAGEKSQQEFCTE
jgi:hypothetical protein